MFVEVFPQHILCNSRDMHTTSVCQQPNRYGAMNGCIFSHGSHTFSQRERDTQKKERVCERERECVSERER